MRAQAAVRRGTQPPRDKYHCDQTRRAIASTVSRCASSPVDAPMSDIQSELSSVAVCPGRRSLHERFFGVGDAGASVGASAVWLLDRVVGVAVGGTPP